jgi:hypothetical protein
MEKGIARVFSKKRKIVSLDPKPYTLKLKCLSEKKESSVHHEKQETRKRDAIP